MTGAAGFIGSHVCDALKPDRWHVIGLDDLSGGFADNVPGHVDLRTGSITDQTFIDNLFAERRIDVIYHLAAYAAEGLSHFIRRFNYQNNLIGSMNLINAAVRHQADCFVFTSSIAVYGHARSPMSESTTPVPADPYGISKYAVELDLAAAESLFGLNYVIFRPHNVYGERQNLWDPYRNVIAIFINKMLRGEPLAVFGDGTQIRAFTHIDDVAPAIAAAADRREAFGQTYNIGADTPVTILELAQRVGETMEMEPVIDHLPERNEVHTAVASHEKAKRVFGDLMPEVSLTDGLRRTVNWARNVGARKVEAFSAVEVTRQLPPAWAKRLQVPDP